ncbi:hypothetical protein [Streptomyces sp. VRA16 Mangrove soil]|uniref:hypothetical protein n=1 Tax=Streptomyces sp. VRA16 Mangrove soil TaxID=2817434 RepID=UPI001A9FD8A0|nr:hypothetical protein [Streptomyces sp. VRA16 Mangrove soil]MBO1332024.1 hypothetical protein [Streptomyces sp. VRA16 Mangrove soil]
MAADRRAEVLRLLLDRADTDGAVTGAALTGSQASGADDRWSDIDLDPDGGAQVPVVQGARLPDGAPLRAARPELRFRGEGDTGSVPCAST